MKTDKTMIILVVIVVVAIAVSVGCYYFYDQNKDQTDKATPEEMIASLVDGQQLGFVDQTSPDITKTIVVIETDDGDWMIQTYGGVEVENNTTLTYEATDIWNSDWASSFSHEGNETMNTMNGTKDVSVWKSEDKTFYIGSDNVLYAYQESGTLYSLYSNDIEKVGQFGVVPITVKYNAFIKVKFDEHYFFPGKTIDMTYGIHTLYVKTMFGMKGNVVFHTVYEVKSEQGTEEITKKETITLDSKYGHNFDFYLDDSKYEMISGKITITFHPD